MEEKVVGVEHCGDQLKFNFFQGCSLLLKKINNDNNKVRIQLKVLSCSSFLVIIGNLNCK